MTEAKKRLMSIAIKHINCKKERLQMYDVSLMCWRHSCSKKGKTGRTNSIMRFLCFLTLCLTGTSVLSAYTGNIIGTATHNGMCYNIISDGTATLFGNLEEYGGNPDFSGPYVVPKQIEYNGKSHTVDAINTAFGNIAGLTAIVIPSTVKFVSTSFSHCPNLKQIIFEDGEQPCNISISIYNQSTKSGVEYIYLGRPVTTEKSFLKLGGESLKTVVIGGGKKEISMTSFDACPNLTTVVIDSRLTWYGSEVVPSFNNCSKLKTVLFTEKSELTSIPAQFNGCTALNVLNIPSTVKTIAGKVLADAPSSAAMVSHAATPPALSYFPFNISYDYNRVYVPAGSVDAYKAADYWNWNYGGSIQKIEEPEAVSVNPTEVTLKVGNTVTLQSESVVQRYVKWWASSNNNVATVVDGIITAVGVGECDIVLKCGSADFSSCHVIVNSVLDGLDIDPKELTLELNESVKLNVKTIPSSVEGVNLKWVSSDPNVVNVNDDGCVTALSPGTAVVTVSSDSGLSADIQITVQKTRYNLTLRIPDGSYVIRNLEEPFTFSVIPDLGWEIASATLNNQEITDIPVDGVYTTPDGFEDCVFAIVLKQSVGTDVPSIIEENINVVVYDNYIEIKGDSQKHNCQIFDTKGTCVYRGTDDYIPFEYKGCFILIVDKSTFKFMK